MGRLCSTTFVCLVACGFDTGGVGSGTATVGSATSTDGDDTNPVTNASMSSTAVDDSTSPTDPSDSVDSTVTDVDPTADTSTNTTATTSIPTTGDDQGTSSTGGGAMVHHLATTDQSACNEPLWCFSGDVWTEYGAPIYGQQCFTSPVPPPFELISVHYVVADVAPELDGFILEVHARDAGGPTDTLAFEQRPAVDATPGSHEHVFETPVQIDDSNFCVGFATPYVGLAAALGMAIDDGTAVGDASFLRIEGPGGCSIPSWSDVIDDLDPTPSGNWCIDVHIRELP